MIVISRGSSHFFCMRSRGISAKRFLCAHSRNIALRYPPPHARAIAFDREASEKDHQNTFKPYKATRSILICDSPAPHAGTGFHRAQSACMTND
jgi:hypothetical protein